MKILIEALKKTESYCKEIPYFPTTLKYPEEHPDPEELLPFLLLLPLSSQNQTTTKALHLAAGFQMIHLSRRIHETIQPQTCPSNRTVVLEGDLLSSAAYKILEEEGSHQLLAEAAEIMAAASEAWFFQRDFKKKKETNEEHLLAFLTKDYGLLCRKAAEIGAKEAHWPIKQTKILCDLAESMAHIYSTINRHLPRSWAEDANQVREAAKALGFQKEVETMLDSFFALDSAFLIETLRN